MAELLGLSVLMRVLAPGLQSHQVAQEHFSLLLQLVAMFLLPLIQVHRGLNKLLLELVHGLQLLQVVMAHFWPRQ